MKSSGTAFLKLIFSTPRVRLVVSEAVSLNPELIEKKIASGEYQFVFVEEMSIYQHDLDILKFHH